MRSFSSATSFSLALRSELKVKLGVFRSFHLFPVRFWLPHFEILSISERSSLFSSFCAGGLPVVANWSGCACYGGLCLFRNEGLIYGDAVVTLTVVVRFDSLIVGFDILTPLLGAWRRGSCWIIFFPIASFLHIKFVYSQNVAYDRLEIVNKHIPFLSLSFIFS